MDQERQAFLDEYRTARRKEKAMEWLLIVGFIGLWFALQLWILPKFGIST